MSPTPHPAPAPAPKTSQHVDPLLLRCQHGVELSEAYAAEARRLVTTCSDFDRPFANRIADLFDKFTDLGHRITNLAERVTTASNSPVK